MHPLNNTHLLRHGAAVNAVERAWILAESVLSLMVSDFGKSDRIRPMKFVGKIPNPFVFWKIIFSNW